MRVDENCGAEWTIPRKKAGLDAFVDAYAEFSAMQSLVKVGAGVMT